MDAPERGLGRACAESRMAPLRAWGRLGAGAAVLLLLACAQPTAGEGRSPAIALQGMTLRQYPPEGEARVARIGALSYDRTTGVVAGEGIVVDLPPDEVQRKGATISAHRAQGDIGGEGAAAQGPIRVETGMGDEGETVGSTWDGERKLLWGDEPVALRGPGYSLAGGSYRYQADEQVLALQGGVEFRSQPAPEPGESASPPLDVESPHLTVDHRERRATFGGGVVLRQGDLVVRCPELVAHYDDSSRIQRVVCSDELRAEQGERKMEAGGGTFDNQERTLTLHGEPMIREGGRWIRGEEMVWEVDKKVARVKDGEAELPAADLPSTSSRSNSAPLGVVASEILYESETRTLQFDGDVVARRGGMTLRASRLVAVAGEEGGLESAWTEGGPVSVVEGNRRARAGRALFSGNGQRLVLTGEPRLTESESWLEGERVIFFIGQDRVEVEKPRAAFPLDRATGEGER